MPKMPRPTARPAQKPAPVMVPKPIPAPKLQAPKTFNTIATGNGKWQKLPADVCISTDCSKPREQPKVMPNPKPKHDPRFIAPPPIDKENV